MGLILRGSVSFLLMSMTFLALGTLCLKVLRMRISFPGAWVCGYFAYFAVFNLIEIPMALLWMSLRAFSITIAVLDFLMIILFAWYMRRQMYSSMEKLYESMKEQKTGLLLLVLVILIQVLAVIFYWDTTVDATYYVGQVSTAVYTNTLGRFDPYTGNMLRSFQPRYFFSSFPMHNAVMCVLTGLHPVVQAKIVMNAMNVVTANMVLYLLGKNLFDDDRRKADLFVGFAVLLQFFTYTSHSPGNFLYTRGYEGKAIMACIVMPMLFLMMVCYWKKTLEKSERTWSVWCCVFGLNLAALCFSGSGLLTAAGVFCGFGPVILLRRRWRDIPAGILCIVPQIVYYGVYFLVSYGYLTLAAQ